MSGGGLAADLVGVEGDGLDLLKHLFYCLHKNFSFPLLVFSVKIAYNMGRKQYYFTEMARGAWSYAVADGKTLYPGRRAELG